MLILKQIIFVLSWVLYFLRYRKAKEVQAVVFKFQSIASFIIYIPALIATFIMVNYYPCWFYNEQVILNNYEFNCRLGFTILVGLWSMGLSFEPISFERLKKIFGFILAKTLVIFNNIFFMLFRKSGCVIKLIV